ncbi:hypothetical protein FOA43_004598 [Brettanomyces nanus]|uniref:Ubiquitin-like domain-containing protein n=1 Tax=Eeniella nana TaxID=13502 RepID=A0A875S6H7_EENNA|nr:uncharacterized protein FOA43_004598 [Brettanomyces nanus]QPG77191.1 hypothetical protein FOA43_004598 [Brettanomyces nanus]
MSGILPIYKSDTDGKQSDKYEFVVRFVGNNHDIVIPIDGNTIRLKNVSTRYIRQEIRRQDPELSNKRLKLIHNGGVLLNHTDFEKELKYYNTADDSVTKIYVHCLVGDELSGDELAKEEELERQPEKSTTEAPRGFERFLSQGFSQQDIIDLRQQFQQIHGVDTSGQTEDGLRDLEDRWIDSTVNNEIDEFPANLRIPSGGGSRETGSTGTATGASTGAVGSTRGSDGTGAGDAASTAGPGGYITRETNVHRELFIGVSVGFFLGVFALFLLAMEAGGIFNKRTRMAIMSGVIVNVSFGVLKAWS